MDEVEDFNEEDLAQFPPWIDKGEFLNDLATVLVKYGLTVGHLYDALAVDLPEWHDSKRCAVVNELARRRRDLTLQIRGNR